jgi:4-amino-4-deoxy-L-arabinose transferase-like glycosyltransferase
MTETETTHQASSIGEKVRSFARAGLRSDVALGIVLGAIYVAVLYASAGTLGYTRDEGFYFASAGAYEQWFRLLSSDSTTALDPEIVDRYWSVNHEHPALMKSLFALSHMLHTDLGWFQEEGTAYRFPGMLMSGLAIAVLFVWGSREFGRTAGIMAAFAYALMPRIFFHAHLACFDAPVAAMWLLATYAYYASFRQGGVIRALVAGVIYGLLLDTKHNSWLLPPALGAHLLLTRGADILQGLKQRSLRIPGAWLAMFTLGPLVFYLGWPWIWHDTIERLREYVQFHTGHEYYNMEFLGETYWKPPMPRLYAWVMTLATVPLSTLLLFAVGVVSALASAMASGILPGRPWLIARGLIKADPEATSAPARRAYETQALWLICLLVSYAPWFSPNTPIFGGTKHWITAYPFMCLFAGLGLSQLIRLARRSLAGRNVRGLSVALAACFITGPLVMTWHSHPWGLSAYTPLVGGAPGAATLGLNRTFWGYTTGAIQGFINHSAPKRGQVYVHDTALQSWEMLRRDQRVRPDLRGTLSIAGSDVALYHHEPHMGRVDYQIWMDYGTLRPGVVGSYDGVPVVWAYRRPNHAQPPR